MCIAVSVFHISALNTEVYNRKDVPIHESDIFLPLPEFGCTLEGKTAAAVPSDRMSILHRACSAVHVRTS